MTIFRRVFVTMLAASCLWLGTLNASALIQLDNTLKPDGIADLPVEEEIAEGDTAETFATRQIVLFVGGIVNRVLLFAGSVAIIFLIVAGAQYIFAFGKDERVEKGKRGMTWSVIGLLVILLSYAIVQGIIKIIVLIDAPEQAV